MINGDKGTFYYQAFFMNDMISQMKTPESVTKTLIHAETYDKFYENLNLTLTKYEPCDLFIHNINYPNGTLDLIVLPEPLSNDQNKITHYSKLMSVSLNNWAKLTQINGAYAGNTSYNHFSHSNQAEFDGLFFMYDQISLNLYGKDLKFAK